MLQLEKPPQVFNPVEGNLDQKNRGNTEVNVEASTLCHLCRFCFNRHVASSFNGRWILPMESSIKNTDTSTLVTRWL